MSRLAFCGGAYQAPNLSADAQVCKNLVPEKDESGAGKSELYLVDREGKSSFTVLGGPSVPGLLEINGRGFAVSGKFFYEIFKDGSFTQYASNITQNANPPSLAASAVQVMLASGGQGYCFDLRTNAFTGPIANIAGVIQVDYIDGFFVAVVNQAAGQPKIFLSAALDGTSWDPGNVSLVSVFPDNIVALKVDHRQPLIVGRRHSVYYFDSGNALFPLDVIQGGDFNIGAPGAGAVTRCDNTDFIFGDNEDGGRMAWRIEGFRPTRISTHAVEAHWQTFTTVADVVAFAYQINGHTFCQFNFPTAQESWVYDVATGLWHQRSYFANGVDSMDRACCHAYIFEKHLVGDPLSGNIYEIKPAVRSGSSWNFNTDAGQPIRRQRRSPYVTSEMRWMGFNSFELEAETGLGDNPSGGIPGGFNFAILADGAGVLWRVTIDDAGLLHLASVLGATAQTLILNDSVTPNTSWQLGVDSATGRFTTTSVPFGAYPLSLVFATSPSNLQTIIYVNAGLLADNTPLPVPRAPFGTLAWSDDRGKTWKGGRQMSFGRLGEYGKRLIQRMLGRCWGTSGRIWEFTYADNVPLRITDAHIEGPPDNQATPRIAAKLRAGA